MPVALITGAARGIGLGAATALAQAGFDVAAIGIEAPGEAAEALASLRAIGPRAVYVRADIADLAGHDAMLAEVAERLGPVDCLVNNAGVTSLRRGDMLELTPESFDRCVAVNLRGTFFLTQAVARAMIADAGRGVVSPIAASSPSPLPTPRSSASTAPTTA